MHLTFILTQVMAVSLLPPLAGVGTYSFIQLASLERTGAQETEKGERDRCSWEKKVTVPGHQIPRMEQCPFV